MPYSPDHPNEVINYRQFPIFPSAKDAREWARSKRRTSGNPTRIEIK